MEIKQNPFYILGVSPQDGKKKISDSAEEKILFTDEELVENAKNELFDNGKRLDAELSWFPGISPTYNDLMIDAIENNFSTFDSANIPDGFAEFNFRLEVFKRRSFGNLKNKSAFGVSVLSLAKMFEEYAEPESNSFYFLSRTINDDRKKSGFPEVDEEELLTHLDTLREKIVSDLKNLADELPSENLIDSMIFIAAKDTDEAQIRASLFTESLLNLYEIEIQQFTDKQSEKICSLIDSILDEDEFPSGEEISDRVNKIINRFIVWSKVVKPVQIISLSKGSEHFESRRICNGIRGVSLTANNEYDMPELSLKLLTALDENDAFEYLPEFQKIATDDIRQLREIIRSREEYEREKEREYKERAESIYYETEFGFLLKDKFKISIHGIEWDGYVTDLKAVTGIRWGGIKKSLNGLPNGTDYKVAFQSSNGRLFEINPNEKQYHEITNKLWRATALQISINIFEQLKNGETLRIGRIEFTDDGVYLVKSGWFSSNKKFFLWSEPLELYNRDGSLFLASEDEEGYTASASYMYDMNTVVLEFMIKKFFEEFDMSNPRLSSLLEGE